LWAKSPIFSKRAILELPFNVCIFRNRFVKSVSLSGIFSNSSRSAFNLSSSSVASVRNISERSTFDSSSASSVSSSVNCDSPATVSAISRECMIFAISAEFTSAPLLSFSIKAMASDTLFCTSAVFTISLFFIPTVRFSKPSAISAISLKPSILAACLSE